MSTSKIPKKYGNARFTLDSADLKVAQKSGPLRSDLIVDTADPASSSYGYAYDRQDNIGTDTFGTQMAIQARWKAFALQCGFQLYVKHSSVKKNNSGNAKYKCKIVNGMQFYDTTAASGCLECPFFINVFSKDGEGKVTAANFSHNHAKHIGSSRPPCAEGSIPLSDKPMRNTTQDMKAIESMVELEMVPAHAGSVLSMTAKTLGAFLKSKGIVISASAISRLKQSIDDKLHGDRAESYQKLEAYLALMADKNPSSVWRFEREADGSTFKRAFFFPNIGIHVSRMAKRLFGFDGAHLKGEMHQRGVFLVATTKDYNNHIIPVALALVPVEDYKNWHWFLELVKEGLGDLDRFTVLSDRQKGLLSAVVNVFPKAGHRFCLRHIMDNISRSKTSLTSAERGIICAMARSDCENDFNLFRKQLGATKEAAVVYLNDIDPRHWVKYQFQEEFKLPTYGEITSNLSEQANNWIGNDMRSSKPLNAFNFYFLKLGELLSGKRQLAAEWVRRSGEESLVPLLGVRLQNVSQAATTCNFIPCMEGAYNVRHLGRTAPGGLTHPWRLVDLPAKECTCGGWIDEEFPCVHAVCAAAADGMPLSALYDQDRLSVAHFRDTYTKPFRPWPTDVTLTRDLTLRVPGVAIAPEVRGKRGLKPGPKPKHKRKKAANGL